VWLSDSGDPNSADRLIEASVRDPFHTWYEFIHVQAWLPSCQRPGHHRRLAGRQHLRPQHLRGMRRAVVRLQRVLRRDESRVDPVQFQPQRRLGSAFAGTNMLISSNAFLANNYRALLSHEASGMKIISFPTWAAPWFLTTKWDGTREWGSGATRFLPTPTLHHS